MNDPLPTVPGAYRWWYLDAVSADGRDALVLIFFCGSVFSPTYAARLRRGEPAKPIEHAAVHVALYQGASRRAWLLAERDGTGSMSSAAGGVRIGASSWHVDGRGRHTILVDDTGPSRLRGEVTIDPLEAPLTEAPIALTPGLADHTWHARVPRGRVRARFDAPRLVFDAIGYHDTNAGGEPMERQLATWTWGRLHRGERTSVVYDVRATDGRAFTHHFGGSGEGVSPRRRTGWGIAIPDAMPAPVAAPVGRLIENTPFYARYLLDAGDGFGMGESLDLRRFDSSIVRWMLRLRTFRHRGRVAA